MKILVPTDFSKVSTAAAHYALQWAAESPAEIVLLHVLHIIGPPKAHVAMKKNHLLRAMFENSGDDIRHLKEEISRMNPRVHAQILTEIIQDEPPDEVICEYAMQNNFDLIIMGSTGATGVEQALMGSTATGVISKSHVPVITIPKHANFRRLKDAVYASDFVAVYPELTRILSVLESHTPRIHVVHVTENENVLPASTDNLLGELIAKTGYKKLSLHFSSGDDISFFLDKIIDQYEADMLIMFTHELTFFDKLFGRSLTRKMASHTWIPLLTLKRQK